MTHKVGAVRNLIRMTAWKKKNKFKLQLKTLILMTMTQQISLKTTIQESTLKTTTKNRSSLNPYQPRAKKTNRSKTKLRQLKQSEEQ